MESVVVAVFGISIKATCFAFESSYRDGLVSKTGEVGKTIKNKLSTWRIGENRKRLFVFAAIKLNKHQIVTMINLDLFARSYF